MSATLCAHRTLSQARHHRGASAYHSGLAAEASVVRDYERRGCTVSERRWTGQGGEVDLIIADGDAVVFVEVKKAKSHAQASQRISTRQMARIAASAGEYLDLLPRGGLTEARFDVALVDQIGVVSVIENAFGCA